MYTQKRKEQLDYLVQIIELLNVISIRRLWYTLSWTILLMGVIICTTSVSLASAYSITSSGISNYLSVVFIIGIIVILIGLILAIYNFIKARALEERMKEKISVARSLLAT